MNIETQTTSTSNHDFRETLVKLANGSFGCHLPKRNLDKERLKLMILTLSLLAANAPNDQKEFFKTLIVDAEKSEKKHHASAAVTTLRISITHYLKQQ